MARRLGANSRKKRTERKGKIRKNFKKVFLKICIAVLMGAVLAVAGYTSKSGIERLYSRFVNSELLSIEQIIISGTVNVSKEQILDKSGLKIGDKLYKVDKKKIKESLKKDPWIERIVIDRKLNGKIIIKVKEREPIALVNDGVIRQVDRNGIVLPFADGSVSSLPVVSGLSVDTIVTENEEKVMAADDMKRLLSVLDEAKRSENHLLSGISQIDLTKNSLITIKLQSHPTIIDMDTVNIADRFIYLQMLENILCSDNAPGRINLCYEKLAYVTDSHKKK